MIVASCCSCCGAVLVVGGEALVLLWIEELQLKLNQMHRGQFENSHIRLTLFRGSFHSF